MRAARARARARWARVRAFSKHTGLRAFSKTTGATHAFQKLRALKKKIEKKFYFLRSLF